MIKMDKSRSSTDERGYPDLPSSFWKTLEQKGLRVGMQFPHPKIVRNHFSVVWFFGRLLTLYSVAWAYAYVEI
jgi:hypothetical protein